MSPFRIVSFLIIALGTVEISPQCVARINLLTGRTYPSGEYPSAAAIQDFNNDGVSDIASDNFNDQNISVFLGNPNGTFGKANTFSVGAGAGDIASADLNGDGNADLVVTDSESAYVVLGNGDGTFGSPSTISLREFSFGIAIADLNDDGILDLAIAIAGLHNSHGETAILIGLGDGNFARPVFYSLTDNGNRLVATDLNHDGKLDLAVALSSGNNALGVLLGNGDGTFQPVVKSVDGSAADIAAADFNGDGNTDLALVAAFDSQVRVVLGDGDGTFQPAATYASDGVEFTVATADLSRDGVPDLVIGGGNNVSILLGNGDGSFGAAVHYGVGQRFARIGYFNADRDPDVVAGGGFSAIGVAFGKGDGTLRAPQSFAAGELFDSGDFDGDGYGDIIDGFPLSFLRGLGDGTFAPAVPIADLNFVRPVASDLNGDGKLDFLTGDGLGSGIYTFLGNGDGTFQEAKFTGLPGSEGVSSVADFNRDGYPDVAVTDSSNQLGILLGRGDGTFDPGTYYPTDAYPVSSVAADFNDDGNPDLALCSLFGGTVAIYLGHGDGTLASPLNIKQFDPSGLGAGDFNKDSKMDLAVTAGGEVKLFLGNGDGTFQAAQSIYSRSGPMKVADVDRDGRPDIAVSPENGTLVVLRGRGDGTFGAATEFPIGSQFSGSFVLSDLNGDAKPEAIVNDLSNYGNSLVVLLNISRPR